MTATIGNHGAHDVISRTPEHVGLANFELADNPTQSLAALVRGEIIPRLMAAHATGSPRASAVTTTRDVVTAHDVETLVPLALAVEADRLMAHVDAVLARGVAVEAILVDLLAPAARQLGEDWKADRCSFVDVTMGLWRLQQIVHDLALRIPPDRFGAGGPQRALFVAMPGDQHGFGTIVIDEVFRCGGWDSTHDCDISSRDLLRRAAEHWYDLIGLTLSCDCHIGALGSLIAALRNVSRNPRLCIMVGGRVFSAAPELAQSVGADGTAPDARSALQLAGRLVRVRAGEVAVCN